MSMHLNRVWLQITNFKEEKKEEVHLQTRCISHCFADLYLN